MIFSPRDEPSDRGPIHWMAGHSVTANLLMLVLLVGGLMMGFKIKKEVFPDFELDLVNISVATPAPARRRWSEGWCWPSKRRFRISKG